MNAIKTFVCIALLVVGIFLVYGAYEMYSHGPITYGGIGEGESRTDWEGWRNSIIEGTVLGVTLIMFSLASMLKGRKAE